MGNPLAAEDTNAQKPGTYIRDLQYHVRGMRI